MNFRATRRERRWAAVVIAASTVAFACSVHFAAVALAPVWAFIPIYESALVVTDVTTAALLFGQLRYFHSRALLALASGYLFTALLAVAHVLSFPGLFTPTGLLGGSSQSTAWLYMFWHGGFPLFVIAYAMLRGEFSGTRWIAGAIAWVALAAGSLAALATAGHALLPSIMTGNSYTPLMITVVGGVWLASVVAAIALVSRRERTSLDVWLTVVMFAWIFDIGLSAVFNAGRFDLGFYAGRLYGLMAASLVLVVLLVQNGALYRQARDFNRELRRAKEAALAAERAEASFLATMSHEIRTPMSGVMGMLDLIVLTKLEAEQRTMIEVVRESGRALMRIVDDILDHSKIQAGKLELRPQPTSIATAIQRVLDIYSGNASSKGLQLLRYVDDRISPVVIVDELRFRQILNNLVSNAIKFTQQGHVSLRAELVERREGVDVVRFTVRDTGPGIPAEDAARLFKPYSQAAGAGAGGTGLGLSICTRLSALMGGLLDMETAPEAGTSVHFTLPLPVADPQLLAEQARDRAAQALDRAMPEHGANLDLAPSIEDARRTHSLILLVDDHPINRLVLAKQLASLGYAAETAENGLDAVEKWSAGGFALIITDCHMPEMSGFDLARHIRACEQRTGAARIPIIACTASAMSRESAECFAAGMDDRLVKPVDREALRSKLQQWLPAACPIDPGVFADLRMEDREEQRELLERFWSYNRDDVQSLRRCADANDADGVMMAAHRITGAARAVGAYGLAEIGERLHGAARAGDWGGIRPALGALERELGRLHAHIESMRSLA
jgi:signal transduction histidine kinase/CheY-like chemotaxis protein/HPt (histidine-containing phosphotransfer) domain-containing protein